MRTPAPTNDGPSDPKLWRVLAAVEVAVGVGIAVTGFVLAGFWYYSAFLADHARASAHGGSATLLHEDGWLGMLGAIFFALGTLCAAAGATLWRRWRWRWWPQAALLAFGLWALWQ